MNWTDLFRFSPRASRQEYAFVSVCTQGISLLFYALQGRFASEGLSWIQFILALYLTCYCWLWFGWGWRWPGVG